MQTAEWESLMQAALDPPRKEQIRVNSADGTSWLLDVLVADTAERHSLGLMFRQANELDAHGMLFQMHKPVMAKFTMKNTYIPLRVYWFDRDGKMLGMADMEPESTSYTMPGRPYWYALEVPVFVGELLGDVIDLEIDG